MGWNNAIWLNHTVAMWIISSAYPCCAYNIHSGNGKLYLNFVWHKKRKLKKNMERWKKNPIKIMRLVFFLSMYGSSWINELYQLKREIEWKKYVELLGNFFSVNRCQLKIYALNRWVEREKKVNRLHWKTSAWKLHCGRAFIIENEFTWFFNCKSIETPFNRLKHESVWSVCN